MNNETLVKEKEIQLTTFSQGGGCGCKISPEVLDKILAAGLISGQDNLLVGNSSKDDAAVLDLGNGQALLSTTDFFMPIVDDALTFGKIAAANSISDIYAMGARPVMAVAILGWPVDKLDAALAQKVMEGARIVCKEAGISIAGGHSIDSPSPFFGLAVNGLAEIKNIKRNNSAREGDLLFLTKSIGTGILATALKRKVIDATHYTSLIHSLIQLNSIGEKLGKMPGVSAMTDVTGFGLAGHLLEMTEGATLSAELYYSRLKFLPGVQDYLAQRIVPDATYRNWNSYGKKVDFAKDINVMEAFSTLPDPQTNGGLLIAADPKIATEVQDLLEASGLSLFQEPVGRLIAPQEKGIYVRR